jgi:hypothetical protein
MATQIKITWEAFGNRPESNRFISSATVEVTGKFANVGNETLLDGIYTATNLKSELTDFGYSAPFVELWNSIEAVLPANRTHTSLSVGDKIQINRSEVAQELQDGPTYKVANIGFELVGA